MKRFFSIILIFSFLTLSLSACYTNTHVVGQGAQGTEEVEAKQWYALFGLVAITDHDSKEMAGGASDYTITTQHTFIDMLIGAFTGIVTIQPMTVKVQK